MGKLYYSAGAKGFFDDEINPTIPEDAKEITPEQHLSLMEAQVVGKTIVAGEDGLPIAKEAEGPTPDQIKAGFISQVQKYLDGEAKNLGYDSIFTAVTYAEEPAVKKFQDEGKALRAWRSRVWESCYEAFDRVQAGTLTIEHYADLIEVLPVFIAPSAT